MTATAGGLLVARGSYRHIEKIFLTLTFVFFAYIFAAFLANLDWGQVAYGTLIPTIQLNSGYIFTLVAAVGMTISPYVQLYVQSAVAEKGVSMKDYHLGRLEVYMGAIFSNAIAFFIIVSTAVTLFG
jgi:Mn2+/Fe2+ NRAMP family transporter